MNSRNDLSARRRKRAVPAYTKSIVLKKTASLFEAAATMGALIGGATPADLSALAAYGHERLASHIKSTMTSLIGRRAERSRSI